jgi:LuxR family maltose regulon positive regulatory protein
MRTTAAIAVSETQQPAPDALEAAYAAAPALRSVDQDPTEAPGGPRRRTATVLEGPRRAADDLVVPRRELYQRLSSAARVTQLSAAAGSGKTVLLRSWVDHAGLSTRAARVLVEPDERDAQRFWLSVLRALRRTTAGGRLLRELAAAPDLDGWMIVERVIEDLSPLEERLWLVIDDLHELRSDDAMLQLESFIRCAPRELQFVLSSRRDPQLGLHR